MRSCLLTRRKYSRSIRGSIKLCQRGSKFDIFLVDKGIEDPNIESKYKYPNSGHPHLNGVSLAGR